MKNQNEEQLVWSLLLRIGEMQRQWTRYSDWTWTKQMNAIRKEHERKKLIVARRSKFTLLLLSLVMM